MYFLITQHRCRKQVFVPAEAIIFLPNFQYLLLTLIFAEYNLISEIGKVFSRLNGSYDTLKRLFVQI